MKGILIKVLSENGMMGVEDVYSLIDNVNYDDNTTFSFNGDTYKIELRENYNHGFFKYIIKKVVMNV